VPAHKPQISLRRPGTAAIPAHLADAFVTGGDSAPSTATAPTPAPEAAAGEGAAAAQANNHLALVADERPDVQASEDSDVRPLRAGIVHRASGRARRRTTVYFDPQLANRLKIHCVTNGLELSDLVEKAVRAHLDGPKNASETSRSESRSA
jgi:hypothetical protein